MTQEEKDLLLKDLCARLPYGVVIKYNNDGYSAIRELGLGSLHDFMFDNAELKPYLRPMSSMTDEEIGKYKCLNDALDENYEVHIDNAYPAFDWLNAHHFDYRGLIEKGLAIEAPKDMYNLNEK